MVDVRATNLKLKQRARNILRELCGGLCPSTDEELDALLVECDGSVKVAIASLKLKIPAADAQMRLLRQNGSLAKVIGAHGTSAVPQTNVHRADRYVLCVDGGGSKCAAFILGSNGQCAEAEGLGCNV
jgi:N-acetylmuramic acid 6-phosphate etherase